MLARRASRSGCGRHICGYAGHTALSADRSGPVLSSTAAREPLADNVAQIAQGIPNPPGEVGPD